MKKLLPALMLTLGLLGFAHESSAQFCPGVSPWVFDDVQASDPFCGYITWMAENGITLGCQTIDANHRLYCPGGTVTRAAMAAFMNRLGNIRVEAVDTGPGLTGGPITSVGTINLAATQLLPTTACTNNQIARWNGSAWVCSTDANSGGTVTSVASGTGLTGGPITTSGALSIAAGYQLPQGCANGQVAKSNGTGAWTCASDATGAGTVTSIIAGAGLTGGTITTSGTIAVDPASATLTNNFYKQGGNAFGAPAIIGTSDAQPFEVWVGGGRALRIERNAPTVNVIAGSPDNAAAPFIKGATIAGGGGLGADAHTVGGDYATVGGGFSNDATKLAATVGGGYANTASDITATVGGGQVNAASGYASTVAGGVANSASGNGSAVGGGGDNIAGNYMAVVAGGRLNQAMGTYSAVAGGYSNVASADFSGVLAGSSNHATALYAVALGGLENNANASYSFVMGYNALTTPNATGSFVYSDSSAGQFGSGQPNEFLVGATGGIGMYTSKVYASGCKIAPGGAQWQCFSSRDGKTDLAAIDPAEVLDRVVALPISTWRYRGESSEVRHLGPMAQDFHAAFGLGNENTSIGVLDGSGVALAAIQGLHAQLRERDSAIAALRAQLTELAAAFAAFKAGAAR